jgi:hypothetical protein
MTTALVVAALLAIILPAQVWNNDPAEMRTLIDVHLYGVVVLLQTSRERLLIYVAAAAPAFVLALALYATTL